MTCWNRADKLKANFAKQKFNYYQKSGLDCCHSLLWIFFFNKFLEYFEWFRNKILMTILIKLFLKSNSCLEFKFKSGKLLLWYQVKSRMEACYFELVLIAVYASAKIAVFAWNPNLILQYCRAGSLLILVSGKLNSIILV